VVLSDQNTNSRGPYLSLGRASAAALRYTREGEVMRALLICGILLFSGAATAQDRGSCFTNCDAIYFTCRHQCSGIGPENLPRARNDVFSKSTNVKSSATCDIPTRCCRRRNSDAKQGHGQVCALCRCVPSFCWLWRSAPRGLCCDHVVLCDRRRTVEPEDQGPEPTYPPANLKTTVQLRLHYERSGVV
jgi:hypothetical protein